MPIRTFSSPILLRLSQRTKPSAGICLATHGKTLRSQRDRLVTTDSKDLWRRQRRKRLEPRWSTASTSVTDCSSKYIRINSLQPSLSLPLSSSATLTVTPTPLHRPNPPFRALSTINDPTINPELSASPSNSDGQHPHHHPSFLQNATPEEKEEWLTSLLRNTPDDHVSTTATTTTTTTTTEDNERIISSYEQTNIDTQAFLIVLNGWAQSNRNDAPQRAEEWMAQLERRYRHALATATTIASSTSNPDSKDRFGTTLWTRAQTVVEQLQPTVECYNAVMEAWARSNNPVPARVERYLDLMERNRDGGGDTLLSSASSSSFPPRAVPNARSYELVLLVLSKGHMKKEAVLWKNAERAEGLLVRMIDRFDNQQQSGEEGEEHAVGGVVNNAVNPTTDSFNYVLRAYTRCRADERVTDRVMDLLRLMESRRREWDPSSERPGPAEPNTVSYCIAMDAWGALAGRKATELYKRRLKEHHNTIGRNKRRNQQQQQLHDEFQHLSIEELKPIYNDMESSEQILQYMHTLHNHGSTSVRPNTVAYNTVIGSYARVSNHLNPDGPLQAETVLRKMDDLREGTEYEEIEDSNTVILPDRKSFEHVIRAWANVKLPVSGRRAEWWMRRMWHLSFRNKDVNVDRQEEEQEEQDEGEGVGSKRRWRRQRFTPSVHTYNAVIQAYHHIGDGTNAERLLEELLRFKRRDNNNVEPSPNSETFSLVIRSWVNYAKTNIHDEVATIHGCTRAYEWLSDLLHREETGGSTVTNNNTPNDGSNGENIKGYSSGPELFSGIFHVVSLSESSHKELLRLTLQTFHKLRESRHHTNAVTYQRLLGIGLRVLSKPADDDRRDAFLRQIITHCRDDGLVSKKFISLLGSGPSSLPFSAGVNRRLFGKDSRGRSALGGNDGSGWTAEESARVTRCYFGEWPLNKNWSRNVESHSIPCRDDLVYWITENEY